MTAPPPTVPSLKESFISAQTNLLAQPLGPSQTWRRANDAFNQPIPPRVLDDILFTLNQTIQQHCRRVYPPQASYNVAEQISSSYLRDAEDRVRGLKESESTIGRELDFVADNSIEALPTSWPIEKDIENDRAAAEEYEAFVQRLTELTEQRRQLRLRVQQLRRIEASVRPLSATEKNNVQDNLVMRKGPVEQELETMHVLLARVTAKVTALPGEPTSSLSPSRNPSTVDLGEMTKARKRNLDNFLSDPRVFPS